MWSSNFYKVDKLKTKINEWIVGKLLILVAWFTEKTGSWTLRPERDIEDDHYYAVRDYVRPLDVILSEVKGAVSNSYNISDINHAMLYLGITEDKYRRDVVEAAGKGVVFRGLPSAMLSKDRIIICRPTFLTNAKSKDDLIDDAREIVDAHKGYDYKFTIEEEKKMTERKYYCFELVAVLLEKHFNVKLKRGEILGHKNITSDAYNKSSDFVVIYDSDTHDESMRNLEMNYRKVREGVI